MLKLLPLILLLGYGLALWHFSAWRTRRMLDGASVPLREPALVGVAERLAQALGVARVPVHVFDVPGVNGLAAPDGRIFLTRGFVEHFRMGHVSAEEMASVIAHEMGHVALGHGRRRMIDFTGRNALRVLLVTLFGRFLPVVGVWIASFLTSALAAGLSRRDEFEADRWASGLLIRAGIGCAPQKSLFQKLDRLTGAVGAATPDWLRSHPKSADRIAAITANERKWAEHGPHEYEP